MVGAPFQQHARGHTLRRLRRITPELVLQGAGAAVEKAGGFGGRFAGSSRTRNQPMVSTETAGAGRCMSPFGKAVEAAVLIASFTRRHDSSPRPGQAELRQAWPVRPSASGHAHLMKKHASCAAVVNPSRAKCPMASLQGAGGPLRRSRVPQRAMLTLRSHARPAE